MTEVYCSMPTKRYHRGRGWTEADLDAGLERLRRRGLVEADGSAFTPAGRELREAIEVVTDRQMAPVLEALGDDLDELLAIIGPWSGQIVEAQGFPSAITQIPSAWGRLG